MNLFDYYFLDNEYLNSIKPYHGDIFCKFILYDNNLKIKDIRYTLYELEVLYLITQNEFESVIKDNEYIYHCLPILNRKNLFILFNIIQNKKEVTCNFSLFDTFSKKIELLVYEANISNSKQINWLFDYNWNKYNLQFYKTNKKDCFNKILKFVNLIFNQVLIDKLKEA